LADYTKNEDEIAEDFYQFVLGFLEKFPEFKGRDVKYIVYENKIQIYNFSLIFICKIKY
jgi:hypothetical protein